MSDAACDLAEPYERLAALAERELLLVSSGDPDQLDQLAELARDRAAIVAALPATPPPVAEAALTRAATTQARTTRALVLRVDEVRRTLGDVDRGRRTARGYGPVAQASPRSLDQAC